ncbi:choice-of-anchor D domain-containing protein [Actinophytocola sp.]|uniref:choice-of-anchor D domain-containing protein n=1 Tax=Actinophytocola sp. TaxID=1872138 RepID=UPI002D7E9EFD|nr:choice-of-anchor D domain-containing protein [Actinophytocola sp.]HET9140162.1 choice-of-anchor D domain-containing protein [Actinophytocola sp.]
MVAGSVAALLVSSATAPPAGADVAPGTTQRVSVQDDEAQAANGGGSSAISADGNSVALVSSSSLDPSLATTAGDGSNFAVFVRDLARGRTVMISRGLFIPPVIGLRGAKTLSLNGARAQPVGVEHEEPPNSGSFEPTISANGRYVAFTTFATNVAPFGTTGSAIVLCDRDPDNDSVFDEFRINQDQQQVMDYRCQRLTSNPTGGFSSVSSPKLSANADRIVWHESTDGFRLRTRVLNKNAQGLIDPGPVQTVPSELDGGILRYQFDPAISGDGNFIAMHAIFDVPCDCSNPDQFNAIMSTDVRTGVSTRVDIENGEPIGIVDSSVSVFDPELSFDGTVIVFTAENFDADHQPYVYAVTVDYPGKRVTRSVIVSRDNDNGLATGQEPAVSADGRYVAFVTDALNMHDGVDRPLGTNNSTCINQSEDFAGPRLLNLAGALPPPRDNVQRARCQVVVRDLILDQNSAPADRVPGTLAGPGTSRNCVNNLPAGASCVADRQTVNPSLSANGARIGFDSAATDLVPNDNNDRDDAFVRTLTPGLRGTDVDFGQVERPGSLVRTAEIEEVGSGPLVIEAVALAGTNASDFTILGESCEGQTLHQAVTCGVTVEFTPAQLGARTAQLQVRAQGSRTPITVNLTGTGTDKPVPRAAEFGASPRPLDFGQRALLSTGPEGVVTVTNGGQQPLLIASVVPVGPGAPGDYTIGTNTCTAAPIPGGGSCTVAVKFSPTLPGDRLANLQFTDNAPGGPHLVGLRGSAGPVTLEVNPGVSPPNRAVTVIGKGYPPGKTVTVTFTNGAPGKATAVVGADGIFRASFMIFQRSKPESRTVVATVDGAPALFANAQLLIVFPTVSPADFVVRG